MPVGRIKFKDIPKARRNRRSRIKESPEYLKMLEELKEELKPSEAVWATLSDSLTNRIKHAHRLFKVAIEQHLEGEKLRYDVFIRSNTQGIKTIYVGGRIPKIS